MNEIISIVVIFVFVVIIAVAVFGGVNVSIGDINIGNSTKKDET